MTKDGPDPFLWIRPELAGDALAYDAYAKDLMKRIQYYFAGKGCKTADEMTQEVLMRLTKKLGSEEAIACDSEEARKGYCFRFARNVWLEWARNPARRESHIMERDDPHHGIKPVDLVAAECLKLLEDIINASVSRLSPMEQEVIRKGELNPEYKPTLVKLGEELGKKPDAMRKIRQRARSKLRELLRGCDRLKDILSCFGMKPQKV